MLVSSVYQYILMTVVSSLDFPDFSSVEPTLYITIHCLLILQLLDYLVKVRK